MKLSDLRKKAGLSQRELAKNIGITGPAIAQYEKKKRLPNLKIVGKLALALNVSKQDIIDCFSEEKEAKWGDEQNKTLWWNRN